MALTQESALRKDVTNGNSATLEHRHFAFIAATLKDCVPMKETGAAKLAQWYDTVESFADACARTNSRFDRRRFLAACGVE